ncbi:MAG: glycosyltransferase family 4 protein [Verrucomicrobiales bacterium]|nr:glycosyltransferase family 4 protein [Verrucomicrobiales bacterium]
MTSSDTSYRILYAVARGDAFGGSSLHVMDMAKRLSKEGHTVKVLVGGTPDMEVPRRFSNSGIDFECLPDLGREIHPANDLKAVIAMRREIRKFDPDLISLHASKAGAIGRLAALGIDCPLVYTPHCWSFVDGFSKAGLYRLIEKVLAMKTTQIVTVSEDERILGLSQGVGKPETTCTIHNGVKDRYTDRGSSKSERNSTEIIMVGRFEEQKDQPLLINALSQLTALDWRLTLIGDGPLRAKCIKLAKQHKIEDRIEFSGYSDSVCDTLAKHDVFALITNWEGFPRSILEAMAASLPVIVTDVGGSRESVLDGKSGYLVAKGNEEELVNSLRKLINDENTRKEMGAEGRRRFRKHFTFDTMFSNYLTLYRGLIQSQQSNKPSTRRTEEPSDSSSTPDVLIPTQKAARTSNQPGMIRPI